jgi:hypothetical protein
VLPPYTNFSGHSTTAYDTPDFYCISLTNSVITASKPGSVIVVYEYKGAPMASTAGAYTFATPFNNSGNPDTFTANTQLVANPASGNVGTGTRTRITIKYVRVDDLTNSWTGIFGCSLLIVR